MTTIQRGTKSVMPGAEPVGERFMMKKVFASDFDGTLYFYKAEEERKLPKEFAPILKRGVDREIADAIVREMNPKGYRLTLDVEGDICVFARMDYPGKYYVITGVDDAPKGLIHQVSIHTESLDEARDISAYINRTYGDKVEAFQNVVEIDIAPKGCSKGKGVQFLKEYMKEKWGECILYGIGDSINDLPLIEASDVSYTFPYAPTEVQEKVTMVVETIVDALDDSMKRMD